MGCRPCSSRVPNMKRNHMDYVYMDFEFIPWILGRDSRNNVDRGMLSVGIVTKHAAYYAINAEMDWQTAFVTGRTARWMTEMARTTTILTWILNNTQTAITIAELTIEIANRQLY